jgi:hypothetical protein
VIFLIDTNLVDVVVAFVDIAVAPIDAVLRRQEAANGDASSNRPEFCY